MKLASQSDVNMHNYGLFVFPLRGMVIKDICLHLICIGKRTLLRRKHNIYFHAIFAEFTPIF